MSILSIILTFCSASMAVEDTYIYCTIGKEHSIAMHNLNQVNFTDTITVYRNELRRNDRTSSTGIEVMEPKIIGGFLDISYDKKDEMYKACTLIKGHVR